MRVSEWERGRGGCADTEKGRERASGRWEARAGQELAPASQSAPVTVRTAQTISVRTVRRNASEGATRPYFQYVHVSYTTQSPATPSHTTNTRSSSSSSSSGTSTSTQSAGSYDQYYYLTVIYARMRLHFNTSSTDIYTRLRSSGMGYISSHSRVSCR